VDITVPANTGEGRSHTVQFKNAENAMCQVDVQQLEASGGTGTYPLVYDLGGGTIANYNGGTPPGYYTLGYQIVAPTTEPEKDDCTFGGWLSSATGYIVSPGEADLAGMVQGGVTFTAQWETTGDGGDTGGGGGTGSPINFSVPLDAQISSVSGFNAGINSGTEVDVELLGSGYTSLATLNFPAVFRNNGLFSANPRSEPAYISNISIHYVDLTIDLSEAAFENDASVFNAVSCTFGTPSGDQTSAGIISTDTALKKVRVRFAFDPFVLYEGDALTLKGCDMMMYQAYPSFAPPAPGEEDEEGIDNPEDGSDEEEDVRE
jgi:uncharacterized repeat protein (TIGR02543 family)